LVELFSSVPGGADKDCALVYALAIVKKVSVAVDAAAAAAAAGSLVDGHVALY
jgi:hypothetical protein